MLRVDGQPPGDLDFLLVSAGQRAHFSVDRLGLDVQHRHEIGGRAALRGPVHDPAAHGHVRWLAIIMLSKTDWSAISPSRRSCANEAKPKRDGVLRPGYRHLSPFDQNIAG